MSSRGESHASCSRKRTVMKARIRALETEQMAMAIAYQSLLDEIRQMMQGTETVIPDRSQL